MQTYLTQFYNTRCLGPRGLTVQELAERVAGEEGVGGTVGYANEWSRNTCWRTRLAYKTYGVELAEWMASPGAIDDVELYTIDEVHERKAGDTIDEFLTLLKHEILPAHPNIKVLFLSATMPASLREYFACNRPCRYTIGARMVGA